MTTLTLKFGDLEVEVTGSYLEPRDCYEEWYFSWETAETSGVSIVPLLEYLGRAAELAFDQAVVEEAFKNRPEPIAEDYDWIV